MTTSAARPAPCPVAPPDLAYLGPTAVVPGDNAAGYDTLLARLIAEVGPGNVVEEAWIREFADLVWEAARARRLKAALMNACADEGMQELLQSLNVQSAHEVARRWAAREPQAVAEVDAVLARTGLDITHVMACALSVRLDEMERIDRMAVAAEVRRTAAVREIVRHREHAPFHARLHEAAARIADAEFAQVAASAGDVAEAST